MSPCIRENSVDCCRRRSTIVQVDLFMADCAGHILEDMKITVSESMVQQGFLLLESGGGTADDVDHGDMFAVSSGNTVDG